MEGGLNQINDNLQRIRELAVQDANDTNTTEDRTAIEAEITERAAEMDRVAGGGNFKGTNLLNAAGDLNIQVGAGTEAGDVITVSIVDATSATLGITAVTGGDHAAFQGLIDQVDTAVITLDTNRVTLGTTLNRFDSVIDNLATLLPA